MTRNAKIIVALATVQQCIIWLLIGWILYLIKV